MAKNIYLPNHDVVARFPNNDGAGEPLAEAHCAELNAKVRDGRLPPYFRYCVGQQIIRGTFGEDGTYAVVLRYAEDAALECDREAAWDAYHGANH